MSQWLDSRGFLHCLAQIHLRGNAIVGRCAIFGGSTILGSKFMLSKTATCEDAYQLLWRLIKANSSSPLSSDRSSRAGMSLPIMTFSFRPRR